MVSRPSGLESKRYGDDIRKSDVNEDRSLNEGRNVVPDEWYEPTLSGYCS